MVCLWLPYLGLPAGKGCEPIHPHKRNWLEAEAEHESMERVLYGLRRHADMCQHTCCGKTPGHNTMVLRLTEQQHENRNDRLGASECRSFEGRETLVQLINGELV